MNILVKLIFLLLFISTSQAGYTIKVILDNEVKYYNWLETDPIIGEWENIGIIYDCSNWSPETSTINIGQSFTQTATNCNQDQTRTVQDKEIDEISEAIRDNGEPYIESRTITINDTREAIGTKETWVAITPTYTEWVDSGSVYGCSNWSPDPSTVNSGVSFTQTATDCSQDQTRLRQEREQETTTNEIRNNGPQVTENTTIAASSTRTATGTKITAITPTISSFYVQYPVVVMCGGAGNSNGTLRWSGSNVSYYVISGPDGTKNLGSSTSYSTKKTGTFTITGYSSTGHTASRSVAMTAEWEPCG